MPPAAGTGRGLRKGCRRRSTLPRPLGRSTIDAAGLNGRVRDGNGCGPCALVASDMRCRRAARQTRGRVWWNRCTERAVRDADVLRPLACGGAKSSRTGDADRYARSGLPRVHGRPPDGVVSPGPSVSSRNMGGFISGAASHLDAFSGYPRRSSLPGAAPGGTAGTRADRPTRSSRTRVRAPQPSGAHDGYRPNCLTTF